MIEDKVDKLRDYLTETLKLTSSINSVAQMNSEWKRRERKDLLKKQFNSIVYFGLAAILIIGLPYAFYKDMKKIKLDEERWTQIENTRQTNSTSQYKD